MDWEWSEASRQENADSPRGLGEPFNMDSESVLDRVSDGVGTADWAGFVAVG